MDSNTHSTSRPTSPASPSASQATGPSAGRPDSLATLTAAVEELAAEDLNGLADAVAAERVLGLRRLLDRLEGHWLAELAAVDARGAAGADHGVQAPSTAGWLRNRLHLSHGAAHSSVRTARAVFRGPLTATAKALTDGTISPAHAAVLAHGTQDLPAQVAVEAEPVLVEAAGRPDPPRLRRVLGHLQLTADPEAAEARTERQHGRRGLWLSSTLEGMVAVDGLLDPEAGQIVLAALEPLARPHSAEDARSGGQRRADALTELARRSLEGGTLPKAGGIRPQLSVLVDLASLLGRGPPVGGEAGWAGPLAPEVCRRLACDGAVTRVLVSRQPTSPHRHNCDGPEDAAGRHHPGEHRDATRDPELTDWLRTAAALLPPILGGAPSQPLDLGRTSRVVSPAQHRALAIRDGGCVFPDCGRPLAWCEAHHLWHWLDGGPTDLDNLILLCRAHHRAVHEGGWQLHRQPDGRCTTTPPSGAVDIATGDLAPPPEPSGRAGRPAAAAHRAGASRWRLHASHRHARRVHRAQPWTTGPGKEMEPEHRTRRARQPRGGPNTRVNRGSRGDGAPPQEVTARPGGCMRPRTGDPRARRVHAA